MEQVAFGGLISNEFQLHASKYVWSYNHYIHKLLKSIVAKIHYWPLITIVTKIPLYMCYTSSWDPL